MPQVLGEGDVPLLCLSLREGTCRGDARGTSWLLYCCGMGDLCLRPQEGCRGAALLTGVFPFATGAGTWGLSNCLIVRQRGRLSRGAGSLVQPAAARGIPAAERLPASSLAGSTQPQHVLPAPRDPAYASWQEPQPSTPQPPAAAAGSLTGRENLPKGAGAVRSGRSGPGHVPPLPGGLLVRLQPRTGCPVHAVAAAEGTGWFAR